MALAVAAVVSTSLPATMAVEPFPNAVGGSAGAAVVADEYARAQKSYDSNPVPFTRQSRFRSPGSPEFFLGECKELNRFLPSHLEANCPEVRFEYNASDLPEARFWGPWVIGGRKGCSRQLSVNTWRLLVTNAQDEGSPVRSLKCNGPILPFVLLVTTFTGWAKPHAFEKTPRHPRL